LTNPYYIADSVPTTKDQNRPGKVRRPKIDLLTTLSYAANQQYCKDDKTYTCCIVTNSVSTCVPIINYDRVNVSTINVSYK